MEKTPFFAAALCALAFCACSGPAGVRHRPATETAPAPAVNPADWSYHPSIERGLELLSKKPQGRALLAQLSQSNGPAPEITYGELSGPWPRYIPSEDKIIIPPYARELDYTVAMTAAFGLALRQSYRELHLEDFTVETFQMAAMLRLRAVAETGLPYKEALSTPAGREMLDELCNYVQGGRKAFLEKVAGAAIRPEPEYGFPYESLDQFSDWVKLALRISDRRGFVSAIRERIELRAERGILFRQQADADILQLISLTDEQLIQEKRAFAWRTTRAVREAYATWRGAVAQDKAWAANNSAQLERWAEEMSFCSVRVPDRL